MTEKKSLLDRIENLPRAWIYIIMVVPVALPLLVPLGIPIPIEPMAQRYWNTLEELPSGSVVIIDLHFSAGEWASAGPPVIPVTKYLLDRTDLKLVFLQFNVEQIIIIDRLFNLMPNRYNARNYGEDIVVLMYVAGAETAVASLAEDVWATSPTDRYGTPLSEIPMMADIRTGADYDLILSFHQWGTIYNVRQVNAKYGTPVLGVCESLAIGMLMPYYYGGQLVAAISGEKAGAQFELLVGEPGAAVSWMDATNMAYLIFVIFLWLPNIAFWLRRKE